MKRGTDIAVLGVSCLFLWAFLYGGLDWPCVFKSVTGLPCPGCGGMRAARLFFDGRFAAAAYANPLSVAFILWAGVSCIWLLADIVRGRDTYWAIYCRKWPRWAVILAVLVLLANWAWNFSKRY